MWRSTRFVEQLAEGWRAARATARLAIGLPDYDTYVAHMRHAHPDARIDDRVRAGQPLSRTNRARENATGGLPRLHDCECSDASAARMATRSSAVFAESSREASGRAGLRRALRTLTRSG